MNVPLIGKGLAALVIAGVVLLFGNGDLALLVALLAAALLVAGLLNIGRSERTRDADQEV